MGVAIFGVFWTQLLVFDVPFCGWGVMLSLDWRHRRCGRCRLPPRGRALAGLRRPEHARLPLVVRHRVWHRTVGLLLEALFRSARLQSLQAFDAWAFWVPKAKAIYFFGGLDEQIFTTAPARRIRRSSRSSTRRPFTRWAASTSSRSTSSSGSSWRAGSRRSPGCLYRHVPAWLLWSSLLLVLVVPRFGEGLLTPQADMLVDLLFVVGALQLTLWLRDGQGWRLAASPPSSRVPL